MIILGIDPGTASTGYGVIGVIKKSKKLKCLEYGVIRTNNSSTAAVRLTKINSELNKLIKKYKPEAVSVERVYFFKNLKTIIPVSQAKGVILFTAAKKKLPIYEFTPLQVKLIITGYGKSEKEIVQKKVKLLFKLKEIPKPDDAADALAVAACCAKLFKKGA